MSDLSNGFGLSGRDRLERIERVSEHTAEMVGDLGNKLDLVVERESGITRRLDEHERHHQEHQATHDRVHRALDFRWYGVIGGMGLFVAYVLRAWGVPT